MQINKLDVQSPGINNHKNVVFSQMTLNDIRTNAAMLRKLCKESRIVYS